MKHQTKFKGDIGQTQIIADLTKNNIDCCLPISEHLPFDLIGFKDGICYKIQSKFSSEKKGKYTLRLRSNKYDNTRGGYSVPIDRTNIDIFAVYCHEINKVFYIKKDFVIEKGCQFSINPEKHSELFSISLAFNIKT